MKKVFFFLPFIVLLACNRGTEENKILTATDTVEKPKEKPVEADIPEKEKLLAQITDMEKELFSAEKLDVEKAKKMVSLYDQYYQHYHLASETPDFLYKAGEITENINQPYRAINYYTRCYEEYPAYKLRAECLFRMANLYDFKLSNYIKAKALYEEVKEQYPKTHWATDADAAIKLMSKSDQDMIREFEKKNGVK